MNIPILELKRQFLQIKSEVEKKVAEVLSSGSYILGENVSAFEEEFAAYCQAKYGIGVASGTDALKIALRACDIGEGDEVITTPFTFVATTEAIHSVGAKIVFADIDLDSYTIDPREIEKKITQKTKAIICVHLYGQPCDMQALTDLSRKYNLKLIEDCAQAVGAEYRGKRVAVFGDVGCFSFFPSKNLGAFGDGGIIVTNNKEVAEKARVFRVYGSRNKYEHIVHGLNSRLDELQAAILRVKLRYLNGWNKARRENTAYYNKRFSALEEKGLVVTPKEQKDTRHVYHLYVLRTKKRDELMDFLKARGVGTAYHYPIPLHLQEVYKWMEHREGDFPNSELAAGEILSLPLFPELTKGEIDYIARATYDFFDGKDK